MRSHARFADMPMRETLGPRQFEGTEAMSPRWPAKQGQGCEPVVSMLERVTLADRGVVDVFGVRSIVALARPGSETEVSRPDHPCALRAAEHMGPAAAGARRIRGGLRGRTVPI